MNFIPLPYKSSITCAILLNVPFLVQIAGDNNSKFFTYKRKN